MGATRIGRHIHLIILVGICTATATAGAFADGTNLALNRPFRCSVPILTGWNGLNDGITDSDSAPGCFATANVDDYPRYITVDLGSICQIGRVAVHNSANGNTKQISIECSTDNQKYQPLRQAFIFMNRKAIALQHEFQPREARYVRITLYDSWQGGLGGDNCLFLREIEVFGKRTDAASTNLAASAKPAFNSKEHAISYPSLKVFRRYCLADPHAPLRIAIIGDASATASAGNATHWTRLIADRLAERFEKIAEVNYPCKDGVHLTYCETYLDTLAGSVPDIFIVSVGHDAAVSGVPVSQFRAEVEDIIAMLCETTDALILVVTPAPVIHNKEMGAFDMATKVDSAPYAWQAEMLANQYKLPLLRTSAVLASSTFEISELYKDNLHLSERGHTALAIALDILLAGE